MRRTVLSLAALVSLPVLACPSSAEAPPRPTAIELVRRCVKAHQDLGPVTVRFTITTAYGWEASPLILRGVERRNDATHRVTEAQMTMRGEELSQFAQYVNGAEQITYDRSANAFRRENARDLDQPSESVAILTAGLAHPATRARWAKAHVEGLTFRGEDAYRFTLPLKMEGVSSLSVIVGRADGLLRKRTLHMPRGTAASVTYSYDRMDAPFPSGIFTFTPPEGAVEAMDRAK